MRSRSIVYFGAILLLCVSATAQQGLHITPSDATILKGESRYFRLNGLDGRPVSGAEWESDDSAVRLQSGAEAFVTGVDEGEATIRATLNKVTVTAKLKVMGGPTLPEGTIQWAVDPIPGFQIKDHFRGSANGPALRTVENSEVDGHSIVRSFTSDGRELGIWGDVGKPSDLATKPGTTTTETRPKRLCGSVHAGMTAGQLDELLIGRQSQKAGDHATLSFHEANYTCTVTLDPRLAVVLKKSIRVDGDQD